MSTFIPNGPTPGRRRAAMQAAVFINRQNRLARVGDAITTTLTGSAVVGQVLTVGYEGTASNVSYQWLRGSTPIAGATANDYTLVTADEGYHISCVINYTAASGFRNFATSSQSAEVEL